MRDLGKDSANTLAVIQCDPIDALTVGQSLRTLARNQRTPHGTREFYARIGQQLVDAARVAMKTGGAL